MVQDNSNRPLYHHEEPVLDAEILESLKSMSKEDFGNIVELYLTDVANQLITLKEEISNSNYHKVMYHAHSMASTSLQVGAVRLAVVMRKLEAMGKNNKLEGADTLIEEANNLCIEITNLLKEHIKNSS